MKNPVFIVGCQRSGTSLLRNLLDGHPSILIHPDEPQFILGLYNRFGLTIKNKSEAIAYLSSHPYFPSAISEEAISSAFKGDASISLVDFIRRYVAEWGGEELRTRHAVLKHPRLIFHLNLITAIFPDALILHIVRDPRANVLSQRTRWPRFTIWECAMLWKKAVRSARKWGKFNSHRYHEIQYEHLIQNPSSTIGSIIEAIGIPHHESSLTVDNEVAIDPQEKVIGATQFLEIDPTRVNRWKNSLSPLEIRRIEYCCKNEMRWWRYTPTTCQVPTITLAFSIAKEWILYMIKSGGRKMKAEVRQAGWRMGFISRIKQG